MKPVETWILIADGARARVLANRGTGKGLAEVEGMSVAAEHLANRQIMADRQGRTLNSATHMRHALAYPTDPKRHREQGFAASLAKRLEQAVNRFDRLILVAAPATLGDLRQVLPARVRSKVVGELAKDLTHIEDEKIAPHVSHLIAL